jgi:PAS domain S-box-containing protein
MNVTDRVTSGAESSQVRHLARFVEPARDTHRCRDILGRFLGNPTLNSLPVVDAFRKPIALLDRRAFIEFFSRQFTQEIYGPRSLSTLLACKDYESIVPILVEDCSSVNDVARVVFEAGMHHALVGVIVTAQGCYFGIADVSALLKMITGQNEIALKESEARARSLVEAAFDGVMTHDQGVILDANPRFAHLFGYESAEELIGRQCWDILYVPKSRETLQECLRQATIRPIEIVGMRKDGTTFMGEMQSCESVYRGKTVQTVAIRDLTELKRAEGERARLETHLRESQKMEALGTLAGGVAHDFNNALATILGNLELARQDVGPAHPALESLNEIDKASSRAKALVQQILAFGRRQVLERREMSLTPVVTEAARLLRATLPAGVGLNVECAADAPLVLADAMQIQQVLLNLCTNAWHSTEGEARPGMIEIRLEAHVQVPGGGPALYGSDAHGVLPAGRYARLTVQDNGRGMDPATQARIFEPFFTTKPVNKGVGLGLAVVHGIVKEHGASIEVLSTPGIGTVFMVDFPAVADVAAAPPTGEARAATRRQAEPLVLAAQAKHVLYVDDDESIVFLMKRLLERQGYRVSAYTDPAEAVAAARADPGQFDLAVTDYNMPGMSGLDVVLALQQIRRDLPVALASGFITEELHQKAIEAGAHDFIYKPNTVDEFCRTVALLANGRKETATSPDHRLRGPAPERSMK